MGDREIREGTAMSTPQSVRAASRWARLGQALRRGFGLAKPSGGMPVCPCEAEARGALAARADKPDLGRGAPDALAATASCAPDRERIEPDPERLARVASYALSGYFHTNALSDMFVFTPDIWIEDAARRR